MSNDRPVKTKCWIKFIESKGCKYKSSEASHDKWRCPGCIMSIIVREGDKDVPFGHIKTSLSTMKIEKAEFWAWVKENC